MSDATTANEVLAYSGCNGRINKIKQKKTQHRSTAEIRSPNLPKFCYYDSQIYSYYSNLKNNDVVNLVDNMQNKQKRRNNRNSKCNQNVVAKFDRNCRYNRKQHINNKQSGYNGDSNYNHNFINQKINPKPYKTSGNTIINREQITVNEENVEDENRRICKDDDIVAYTGVQQNNRNNEHSKGIHYKMIEKSNYGASTSSDIEESLQSDEEEEYNRIGDVLLQWYSDFDHIGYDIEGKRIKKSIDESEIGNLLSKVDDPHSWRKIKDIKNNRIVELTETDIEIIRRIRKGYYPDATFDENVYFEYNNPDYLYSSFRGNESKSRMLPSKWEGIRIFKLIKMIREGKCRMKPKKPPYIFDLWGGAINVSENFFSHTKKTKMPHSLAAPKMSLPTHSESYNPPEEYLLDAKEMQQWKSTHWKERAINYLPHKYSCLRLVPAYNNLVLERFHRCQDLYLCARQVKTRMNVDPESLLPKLPSLESLRPFPRHIRLDYELPDMAEVLCLAIDPSGQWLAVGTSKCTLCIFDVISTHPLFSCRLTENEHRYSGNIKFDKNDRSNYVEEKLANNSSSQFSNENNHDVTVEENKHFNSELHKLIDGKTTFEKRVECIAWHPRLPLLAFAVGSELHIVLMELPVYRNQFQLSKSQRTDICNFPDPCPSSPTLCLLTEAKLLLTLRDVIPVDPSMKLKNGQYAWLSLHPSRQLLYTHMLRNSIEYGIYITHSSTIKELSWHNRGLYLVSICPSASSPSDQCAIHSLAKHKTINPIKKAATGKIQCAAFHPTKPWFIVGYYNGIRIFDLRAKSENKNSKRSEGNFIRKLIGVSAVSCLDIHPTGEHIVVGSANKKLYWFDLELSSKPYKIMRYHSSAVRNTKFHESFPLMFSSGHDGLLYIFHSKVYDDFIQNPFIVPIKKLQATPVLRNGSTFSSIWHPLKPWVFTGSSNGKVFMWA